MRAGTAPVQETVAAHSVAGGKGFGTPSILDYLPLKKFDLADARHVDLAIMSRRFHQITVMSAPPDDERKRPTGLRKIC